MSKKMWSKIFKTSKTTKVAKLTTASSANKRCSIYEEYQQLNGGKVEGTKKQKKLAKGVEQQSKQAQEQEAQQQQQQQQKQDELQSTAGDVASATEASTHHKNAERNAQMTATTTATTMSINKNSEVTQTLGISDVTLASSSNTTTSNSNNSKPPADANDQLIANKNSNNNNKQQSTFAKVVSSFTLKRNNNTASAQKQQQPQQQQLQPTTKGNGNVKAAGKLPKNNSNTIASTADPYPDAPAQLVPCPICQRTFNPVPLQKHVGICEKMATKKRNVFDSSRQRREGTELASYPLPKNFGLPPTKQEARGQSPKPLQHIASPILTRKKSSGGEELARSTARASMRKLAANAQSKSPCTTVAASAVAAAATASQAVNNSNNISQMTTSTASTTSLPGAGSFTRDRMRSSDRSLAKRIQPPPAEQCPHCERCFGPKAYDRHVEWCKEKALQASIKQTTKTEQNLAKERLEARTKYRAPCLKTKRSINRDKYAGLAGDENEFGDSVKQTANGSHNSNNTNNNSSLTNGIGGNDNSNNINSSANGNGNGNGVMSLSMTSSMTSERKPSIMKDFHGTLRTRKTQRNAIELPPPSPRRLAHAANDDYVKSACFDNIRLMSAKLTTNVPGKKLNKRRVTLNAISTQARPQSPQFEKVRTRKYDESLPAVTTEQSRDHCLGDANALSATLTYTACPLNGVHKSTTSTRVQTQPTASVASVCKRRTKLKPKVPSESSIRVDAGTVMTDHDDEPLQESKVRSSQSYELVQKQTQQQEQQLQKLQRHNYSPPLTPPMKMLQTRQTTFDKLPKTTIAVTTVETATTSTAAASHTKLEVNAIRSLTICRPKRKKLVRQSISAHAAPMKAIPLLKESIEMFGAPTNMLNNDGDELKDSDSRTLADDETDDEIKVIKAPPKLARDKSFVLSGLTCDKYDPFLSAKRQLEELCSSSPPNNPSFSTNLPKTTPQTPVSPAGLPAKMSTSLTLSSSTPNSSPLTNNAQNLRQTATPTVNATKTTSNFRRTSSLRGPRRSPMLSSRPLFAQNHRPTIQRGLSDEGPISTNFLKPEEYDEMPVRSVCVNDYAVTKSPRVARRDNSLSNRKQCLKLNVQGAGATMTSVTNTPNRATMLGVNSSDELMNSAAKYLSKTDSLAAFLKYEKELEKLNAQAAADASASLYKPNEQNANDTSATNLHSHIISKELKEKSNTLSKQNSAKSIKAELIESPKSNTDSVQENLFQHLPTPVPKTPHGDTSSYDRGNVSIQKTQAVRLEAIALPQATSTPIAKPSTTRALTQATPTQLPVVSRAINLNTLLGESRPTTTSSLSAYSKDVKSSSSNEYIDPKLINKCDNLPVNLNSVRTLKSVGANNVERRLDFSSSSSECSATQAGPISQLTKLLPLTKPTEVLHVTAPVVVTTSPAVNIPSRPSTTDDSQPNAHPTLSQRSSAEGRNLLNRKKRLGRNHFLYDVSPEADDSCSADDEANRSSVEYYESKYKSSYQQQQQQQQQQPQTCFVNTRGQTTTLKTPPIVPPLPIFDDFDFEEFLSSFENDDEQFPLFKDCREFLLNRSSNKQRSTQTPNSINTNNNTNHNNNNSKVNQHTTTTKDYNNTTNHFQFPSLASNKYSQPTHLLTPSSHRSRDESRPKSKESSPLSDRYEELKRVNTQSHAYMDDGMTTKRHADAEHKKREIFISIETEPNEHGRSPISPDSLRSMVGNPQTMVEVEVDGLDNKFSKISDDDEQLPPRHVAGPSHAGDMMMRCTPFNNNGNHLPNVQLNNAKNLIQRMQDDFRQMSEEVGANIRQAMTGLNAVGTNTSMLYGNEQVGMSAGIGGRGGGTYVPRNTNTTPPPSATSVGAVAPMYAASGDVSGDACGDSDDMSSLDGYPISSKSSRRGVGSKLSADSAYGSLSRQRSSELSTTPQRSAARSRPNTSSTTATTTATLPAMLPTDLQTQQHQLQQQQQQQQYHYQQQQQQLQQQQLPQQATQLYKYTPVNARPRRISASSSSDNSDASDCNMKYKQQQQQLFGGVGNKNHNSNNNNYMFATQHSSAGGNNNNNTTSNNNNNYDSPLSSPTTIERTARLTANNTTNTTLPAEDAAATPTTAANNNNNKGHYSSSSSLSSTNAAMSASMKMSKFCHECGAKFLVEQAKFCMDCGVKRIVL